MKIVLLLLIGVILYSCDGYKLSEKPEAEVVQYVNLDNGKYTLHTFVCITPEDYKKMGLHGGYFISLYGTDITGSFEYIKTIKHKEYKKADSFLHTPRVKFVCDSILLSQNNFKKLKDSITTLNKF